MSNPLSYGAISQIYLSGASERFVASNSGDYYWWNDFNRSYQPIDTSSLPGQIIGVDSDNAGNLAFLTSGEQTSRLRREFTYHLSLPQGFALISPFKGFSHSAIKVINEVKDASFELFCAHETASSE